MQNGDRSLFCFKRQKTDIYKTNFRAMIRSTIHIVHTNEWRQIGVMLWLIPVVRRRKAKRMKCQTNESDWCCSLLLHFSPLLYVPRLATVNPKRHAWWLMAWGNSRAEIYFFQPFSFCVEMDFWSAFINAYLIIISVRTEINKCISLLFSFRMRNIGRFIVIVSSFSRIHFGFSHDHGRSARAYIEYLTNSQCRAHDDIRHWKYSAPVFVSKSILCDFPRLFSYFDTLASIQMNDILNIAMVGP